MKGQNAMLNNELLDESYRTLRVAADISHTYYHKPLIVCYSGGKDSDVLLQLARESLKPDEFEMSFVDTTVEAPQTRKHTRAVFADCEAHGIHTEIRRPTYKGKPTNMFDLIVKKKSVPTRIQRFCCKVLKESSTPNRFIVTGVREAESTNRRGRDLFGITGQKGVYYSLEHVEEVYAESLDRDEVWDCKYIENARKNAGLRSSPIYHWSDSDVWSFIRDRELPYNELYDMGYTRVGCILCPMSGYRTKIKQLSDFPQYKKRLSGHLIKCYR